MSAAADKVGVLATDLRCYTCDARDPNCEDCGGTGKREALQNNGGAIAAMRSATQAMRFVLRTDMIPGSFDETCECLESATAEVTALVDQRDALVGVVFALVQSLPKGPRSLSSNAQTTVREAATLACAILDRHEIDPEAFARYAKTLWGTEWRATPKELTARYAKAVARVTGQEPRHV